MTDRTAIQAIAPDSRQSVRDPYVEEIIGPGRLYETETVLVSGVAHEVFQGAPRTLADIYSIAEGLDDKTMIINADQVFSYGEIFSRAAHLSRRLKQ